MMNENLQTVVDSVNNILNDTNLTAMTESVVERLVSFGIDPNDADTWTIAFSTQKTVNHVLNQINDQKVPTGLKEIVVDMICGEVMNVKYTTGQLDMETVNLDGAIHSVQQGDTTVTFATNGSNESGGSSMTDLIDWLIKGKGCDFLCYRKMRW
jgi:hypothetical protein